MPINELENLRGFPKIGDFRKGGEMVENEDPKKNRIGRDLDYFRVTFGKGHEHLKSLFDEMYGDKPVHFPSVFLDGQTVNDVFDYWWMDRTKTKVLHKCDGFTQVQYWDVKAADYGDSPIECVANSTGCDCKRRGTLKILLPDFVAATGYWGYFAVHTGSFYDIANIAGYLRKMYGLTGNLSGIPFVLSRVPQTIVKPNIKGEPGDKLRGESALIYLYSDPGTTRNLLAGNFTQRAYAIRDGRVDASSGEMIQIAAEVSHNQIPANMRADESDLYAGMEDTDGPVYDLERVKELTLDLFEAEPHQDNLIAKMIESGDLFDDMTTTEAVTAIKANRADRRTEKEDTGEFWGENETVKTFLANIQTTTKLQPADVFNALNHIFPANKAKTKWSQFKGISKDKAWALCLLYASDNNFEKCEQWAKDSLGIVAELARLRLDSAFADQPF